MHCVVSQIVGRHSLATHTVYGTVSLSKFFFTRMCPYFKHSITGMTKSVWFVELSYFKGCPEMEGFNIYTISMMRT